MRRSIASAGVVVVALLAARFWESPFFASKPFAAFGIALAVAQTSVVDEYAGKIRDKIQRRINKAGCSQLGDVEVQLRVVLVPDGLLVTDPEIIKSSGAKTCDAAIARAVFLAQPLPVPADPAMFKKFRQLTLSVRPNG